MRIKGHTEIQLTDVRTGKVKTFHDDNMMTNGLAEFMKNLNKILSIILAILMVISIIPMRIMSCRPICPIRRWLTTEASMAAIFWALICPRAMNVFCPEIPIPCLM